MDWCELCMCRYVYAYELLEEMDITANAQEMSNGDRKYCTLVSEFTSRPGIFSIAHVSAVTKAR